MEYEQSANPGATLPASGRNVYRKDCSADAIFILNRYIYCNLTRKTQAGISAMLNKLSDFLSSIITPASVEGRPEHTLELATAVLLIEVMQSDAESTGHEQATILKILAERFDLSEAELAHLSELGHRTATAANDLHQFTSLINRELELSEKVRIVEYMWQVAYADQRISAHENHLMRKIAALLYIPHGDYVAAKMRAKPAGLK